MTPRIVSAAFLTFLFGGAVLADAGSLGKVAVSKQSFNPTLHESVEIAVAVKAAGKLTVLVLDPDTFVVKTLARQQSVEAGEHKFEWRGDDESGETVPDEAYTVKAEWTDGGKTENYFPAKAEQPVLFSLKDATYSRETGTLRYTLPDRCPCRVHAQAGMLQGTPPTGPVLATLVNAEPRGKGAVIESWRGMDASGTIYIPSLPHWVLGVAALPLPESTIIVVGSPGRSFAEWAQHRAGRPLLKLKPTHHHQGLTAVQNISPPLEIKPQNAIFDQATRSWIPESKTLTLRARVTGPSAEFFAAQPGSLLIFTDMNVIEKSAPRSVEFSVKVPLDKLALGEHIVAVNWGSSRGPAAVQALRVRIESSASKKGEGNATH